MALSKEAYQALEDIVGPEYISDEPAILDSYCYQRSAELINPDQSHFLTRAEAVLLPGSTEEVSAIVKACNRYKIKCKPFSTGWISTASALTEGVVQLDVMRMDRILAIDEKNMVAIEEPYVICAELQAEAMKKGLNCHMIGAGASCSVVAISTSFNGEGADSIAMGHGGENPLGMEWVMPTGDILRTGSLGSGCGWFCGEGPGPSTRGIARGLLGTAGSFGVFTKIAVRLYHWPGPPVLPIEGVIPSYSSPLPENLRSYTIAFPSNQAYADATYKIYDAGIGYILHRQWNKFGEGLAGVMVKILTDYTKTIDNLEEMLKTPEVQKLTDEMRCSYQIVLAGNTIEEADYQDKVLDLILAEVGGRKVAAMSERHMQDWSLLYLIRLPFKSLNFIYGGGYLCGFGNPGSPDYNISYFDDAMEVKRKHIAKGGLVDDGGNAFMGAMSAVSGGGYLISESFSFYDSHDPESIRKAREYNAECRRICNKERRLTPIMQGMGVCLYKKEDRDEYLTELIAQPDIYHWQRKIHDVFDPNNIGDGGYVFLDEPKK